MGAIVSAITEDWLVSGSVCLSGISVMVSLLGLFCDQKITNRERESSAFQTYKLSATKRQSEWIFRVKTVLASKKMSQSERGRSVWKERWQLSFNQQYKSCGKTRGSTCYITCYLLSVWQYIDSFAIGGLNLASQSLRWWFWCLSLAHGKLRIFMIIQQVCQKCNRYTLLGM